MTFVTGQRVDRGHGRPGDLHRDAPASRPARSRPSRPSVAPRPSTREIATEDAATILLRFDNGARGAVSISQISAGPQELAPVRDRRLDGGRRPGTRSSPTSCGSAIATAPTRSSSRNPALMGPAGQAAAALPGGHVEGFADTFGAHFRAVYADVAAGRAVRPARPIPRSPTATTRCSSATPSRESARDGRWVDVDRGESPGRRPPSRRRPIR